MTLVATGVAFGFGGRTLFEDVSLNVASGRSLAVMGPSGSGKTSLLNCFAGIALPSRGSVLVGGVVVNMLSTSARSQFRLAHVGFVFQFGELLPELTALDNVALPLIFAGESRKSARGRALSALVDVDISEHSEKHPDKLSGGERQRVAIARALVHEPELVIADEPTGMLDAENTNLVIKLLLDVARSRNTTLVIATHDLEVAAQADAAVQLSGGRIA